MNTIIGEVTAKYGASGGGHPLAAGGRIPAKSLYDFLSDVDLAIGDALSKNTKPEGYKVTKTI